MSENVKNTETKQPAKISEKNLAVIITAGIVAVVLIVLAVIGAVNLAGQDYGFDYFKTDLDKYISFSESYKDYKIEIDIAKPHDIDVDVSILNLIYKDRTLNEKYAGATITSAYTISAGDTVNIWYRGYLLDEEGNEIPVDSMCNFSGAAPSTLNIGSGQFVPGFELNLIGLNTGDYSKFEKITTGKVNENQVIYVTYSLPNKTDSTKTDTFKNVRIDLSEDIDAIYGERFKSKLLSFNIGEKKDLVSDINGDLITYSDFTINFATECETNPMVVECYFGYDYSNKELRNETAYFEVYVEGIVDYVCPEFNDEYLTKLIEDKELNLSIDELNKQEGTTLVEKYRNFVDENLNKIYEETLETKIKDEIWARISKTVKATKYPRHLVDKMYDYYMNELRNAYVSSGGQLYNNTTGQYTTYDSLSKYIPVYLGLSTGQNWQTYLQDMAEESIKERMAMFYILREENLLPTKAELDAKIEEIRQEYIDEYVKQFMNREGKDRDEYTDEEYNKIVKDAKASLFSFYDDEYFMIKAYQNFFTDAAVEWPEVSTLDDRRAYPLDK